MGIEFEHFDHHVRGAHAVHPRTVTDPNGTFVAPASTASPRSIPVTVTESEGTLPTGLVDLHPRGDRSQPVISATTGFESEKTELVSRDPRRSAVQQIWNVVGDPGRTDAEDGLWRSFSADAGMISPPATTTARRRTVMYL